MSDRSPVLLRGAMPAAMAPGRANGLYVVVVGEVIYHNYCRPFAVASIQADAFGPAHAYSTCFHLLERISYRRRDSIYLASSSWSVLFILLAVILVCVCPVSFETRDRNIGRRPENLPSLWEATAYCGGRLGCAE